LISLVKLALDFTTKIGHNSLMMMKGKVMTDKTPSKRSVAIAIMNANAQEPVPFVVGKIAEAIGVSTANAKSYYRYIAQNGLSNVPSTALAKTPKAPKTKTVKAVVTTTDNGGVRMTRAPKATKVDAVKTETDRLSMIRQAHQRMVADGRVVTHGAKFNYDTREFEDSIPETNEVEDLCEMFSV
jgi:hypothetical protein